MSKEVLAALQQAIARGDKSFDFGVVAEMSAKVTYRVAEVAPKAQ